MKTARKALGRITNEMFLEAMFEDMPPGTYTIVTAFGEDPVAAPHGRWAGRPWQTGDILPVTYDGTWAPCNTYLTISLFVPDEAAESESKKYRRRKKQFHSLRGVMIDDVGTKIDRKRIVLPLTAEVETSPGNLQGWYFIRQDEDSHTLTVSEGLIAAMVEQGLTADAVDPGMKGVTRYGRLPNGINNKAKYVKKLCKPWRVQLRSYQPSRRYSIGQIASAYHLDIGQLRAKVRKRNALPPSTEQIGHADKRFEALARALQYLGLYKGKNGNEPWHAITCPWVHEHTDQADDGAGICEPTQENGWHGAFRCHHSHGERLHLEDLRRFISMESHRRAMANALRDVA